MKKRIWSFVLTEFVWIRDLVFDNAQKEEEKRRESERQRSLELIIDDYRSQLDYPMSNASELLQYSAMAAGMTQSDFLEAVRSIR